MTPEQLLALDAARVWHPYDSVPPHAPPLLVQSALGVRLKLATEVYGHHELIDAMSSWWAVVHGYGNTVLNDALKAQVDEVSHLMMGGLTHEPAILLASKLVDIAPTGLERVFFSDSGSVAIEVAAKMSLQYWQALGHPQKQQFATWRGGYHGDTFLAMSLCDPDAGMHRDWRASVLPQVFMRRPPSGFTRCIDSDYIEHLTSTIRENASRLAAVVVEPILQGAGGMRFHNPAYLSVLREVTRECDVLLIFDEIATGFGRTGEIFAANFAGVSPDIMCVGKALTGGYLPMAATMCTQRVARGVGRDGGVLAHGPTFMGNPLAAAVACASIDLTIRDECRADVRRIERMLTSCLQSASDLDGVIDVRVLGAIAVLQLDHTVDADAASQAALATGVWLRPFGDVVYSLPPYVTADEDVEAICAAMIAAARASKRNQK